jgi:predicted RNase H-like HicB family nuclease
MREKPERIVYPLTFVFKREGRLWSALACEIDVASCGRNLAEAREGIKEAVELHLSYMLEHGLRDKIANPVPAEAMTEFCEGRGTVKFEYHTAIVDLEQKPEAPAVSMQFVRSELAPVDCRYAAVAH